MQNSRALILDLRRYPPNFYGYILRNFLGARESIIAKQLNSDLNYPGKYILTEQDEIKTMPSKFNGKVALLVCETTQSRAEYTALWIQNGYNVTTIGSQTAGAGGMMIQQEFVGGFKSYFTSSGIFYPDMTPVQRNGVKIDIEVKPSIQGIIDGSDEVLEKAIEFINSSE
ncbi:S41 family peptidase [Chondrinema litorale]|uniref:S41 family peptidase n=1 Tax=Chondrinema litorale TaxID=2994555 RepID=UPI00254389D1|nr:S41 family peptidase [Chondrinema litorale]UZR97834.1 S41 family peptidase [Chondrinema litorale]